MENDLKDLIRDSPEWDEEIDEQFFEMEGEILDEVAKQLVEPLPLCLAYDDEFTFSERDDDYGIDYEDNGEEVEEDIPSPFDTTYEEYIDPDLFRHESESSEEEDKDIDYSKLSVGECTEAELGRYCEITWRIAVIKLLQKVNDRINQLKMEEEQNQTKALASKREKQA